MLQRKLFFTVLLWTIGIDYSFADNYTSNQAAFRNDINHFLKEEGHSPTINNETGDINFKMEGINYVVDLNKDYNGPYLVTLSATFGMETLSTTDKARLYEAENTVNSRFRCVKASYIEYEGSNILIFAVESFCHNSEDFKYALTKYLELIKKSIAEFRKLYSGDTSSAGNGANHFDSPYYTTTKTNTSCKILSVDVLPYETRVNFEYINRYNSGGWCSIDESTYILCSGHRLSMVKAEGIPLSPKQHNFAYQGQKLNFTLVFPALPSNADKFDLLESSSSEWKFYNISVSSTQSGQSSDVIGSISSQSGNRIFVNGPILESTYHKWWVNSIELNSNNTVVSKTVEPKQTDTYVMATKDEYIEDCDTGKRYYITSSTLGIEPQKIVLYSTKAKAFSDTFPALPTSVKRISIWSGSDYYVKNLKIR